MSRKPPGTLGVALILSRVGLRRSINRTSSRMSFRKKSPRSGTARKSSRSLPFLLLFGGIFLFNGVMVSGTLVRNLTKQITKVAYERRGEEPPKPSLNVSLMPTADQWPVDEEVGDAVGVALGFLLITLTVALCFMSLGLQNPELGQTHWSMEWLFSFPVPANGIFLAKIGEYALVNFFGWFVYLPLLFVPFFASGFGWWAVPMAFLGALYGNLLVGCFRLLAEVWLRKRFSPARVKNFQALSTVAGMVALMMAFYLALRPEVPAWFTVASLEAPFVLLGLPPAAPMLWLYSAWAPVVLFVFLGVIADQTVRSAARLVRSGLVTTAGNYEGVRTAPGTSPAPAPAAGMLRGVLGKEVRLLMRDRNFMVQTLVLPLVMIGIQLVVNPAFAGDRMAGPRGAVWAFGLGAYVLMFGAIGVLAVERKSLWLLYTFPRAIDGIIREKVVLWGAVGSAYVIGVLALLWRPEANSGVSVWISPLLALYGIWLYAFIGAGLGTLGTDPFADDEQKRVRPEWALLFFMLCGFFGWAIFEDSLWTKLVLVTLTTLVGYAIWVKVAERLPLMLDPTAAPAPRIGMADGLIAVLAFFMFMILAFTVLTKGFGIHEVDAIPPAYALSALITFVLVLYMYWRLKLPNLFASLGIGRGRNLLRSIPMGVGAGLCTSLLGLGSLIVLKLSGALDGLPDPKMVPNLTEGGDGLWKLALLTVVAAPLCEEFLFRGVLYKGMRSTLGVRLSIIWSAVLFAFVHPPLGFVAVFALGVATAWLYEKTGSLWASMAAHATHNGVVVGLAYLGQSFST